jgi:DNA gyrase subunit A
MGRATQGVRLINLTKKNDVIASVCKVMSSELEAIVEQKSREEWAQNSEAIRKDVTAGAAENDAEGGEQENSALPPIVDFADDEPVEE